MGTWAADVTVLPANGVYWKNNAQSSDAWAPQWKSNAKAIDGTTPLIVFTGETGMDTSNGDIYSKQSYTLQAPLGYTIVSYTFNGTATRDDITITPAGGSATLISNGTSLATPLSVDVDAQSTTFALSSPNDAHFTNLSLTINVVPEIRSVGNLSTTKCYTISTVDRGSWVVPSGATQVTSTTKASLAFDKTDAKQRFAFISYNGKWFLYNVGAGKFVSKRGNYTILSSVPNDDVTLLASSGSTDYPTVIAFQNGAYQAGISNGYNPPVITLYNDLADNGNRAVIVEADDFDPTTAQAAITDFLSDPSNITSGNYYRLKNNGGNGYISSSLTRTPDESSSVILKITDTGATTPVGKKIFSLYNEKDSKYLSYTSVEKSTGDNSGRFAWTDAATNSKFVLNSYNASNIYIRPAYPADDNYVSMWGSSSEGIILWSPRNNTFDYWAVSDLTIEVNYKVEFGGEQKGSTTVGKSYVGGSPILPASLVAEAVPACCLYAFDKETVSEANENFTATVTWNGPVKYTTDTTAPEYYNLNIRSKYLVYDDDATGDVKLQETSEPFNEIASWAFIGDPYTGFKLINKTKGTTDFLTYTSVVTGGNHGNNNISFVESGSFSDQYWIIDTNNSGFVLRMKANPSIYFHHDQGSNFLRTCSSAEWSAVHTDVGSTIIASTDEEVLFALYGKMKDMSFGSGAGEYTTTYVGADGAAADMASIGMIIDMAVTSQYPLAYNTLLDIQSQSTLNMPATDKFYRIKGKTSGNYLAAGFANNKFAMSDATDATTIFYFADSKLLNYSTGLYNGLVAGDGTGWNWALGAANASAVTFHDGNTAGGYGIQSATVYLYDRGTNADRGTSVNLSSADARYRSWALEEVTSLPVTIGSTTYATLFAPVALTIPSEVKAYYISSLTETEATLTEIATTIPAGTPVVLKADAAGTYDFAITTGGTDVSASNKLAGQAPAFAVSADDVNNKTYYTLQQNATHTAVGFYPKTAEGSIAGFKAYLPAANFPSAGVKGLAFIFDDEATGINNLNANLNANEAIYNIAGQKLQKMQRGINIVNGKKIIK